MRPGNLDSRGGANERTRPSISAVSSMITSAEPENIFESSFPFRRQPRNDDHADTKDVAKKENEVPYVLREKKRGEATPSLVVSRVLGPDPPQSLGHCP